MANEKKEKVLIVDDDATYLRDMAAFLHSSGYECLAARELEEAFRIYRNENPGAVITDFHIRDQNGLALAWKITDYNEKTGGSSVIILMSGHDFAAEHEPKTFGVDGFYLKTNPIRSLLTQLDGALI